MTSIKVKFRYSTKEDRDGVIYYQIIHERRVRQITTKYRLRSYEWNEARSQVVMTGDLIRMSYLEKVSKKVREDIGRLTRIVNRMRASDHSFSVNDIVDEYDRFMRDYSLFNYMDRIIERLKLQGRWRTSETYHAARESFRKFISQTSEINRAELNDGITLDCLDSEMLERYETWHKSRGNTPNTISFYMRILRAVYRRGVEENAIDNRNPFKHVYTGVYKTVKRALPLSVIRKIRYLDLSDSPSLDFARDMFIMSFYLRGMSFIDMAFLRKTDLKNGYITYRRRKTGQQLIIKWTKEMQQIMDKYSCSQGKYLLPILKSSNTDERMAYRNAGYNINRNLKEVARKAEINVALTMYVARHSWASAAHTIGIPLNVISEGMGHDSELTTRIYLASLDTSVVDNANYIILNSIR